MDNIELICRNMHLDRKMHLYEHYAILLLSLCIFLNLFLNLHTICVCEVCVGCC